MSAAMTRRVLSSRPFLVQRLLSSSVSDKNKGSKKLSLTISDPMILINNVAKRYLSPSRIIMEFVDNAIDDGENFFDVDSNSYRRPLKVCVHVNTKQNYVRIVDNANGMGEESLVRLVSNIGDSVKRASACSSNVNGRFGFGIQSFRAGAEKLNIYSAQDDGKMFKMSFNRNQIDDIDPPQIIASRNYKEFPGDCRTGTDIIIEGWGQEWLKDIKAKSLQEQIQRHFEIVLNRNHVEIQVIDDSMNITHECSPKNYHSMVTKNGHIIEQKIFLSGRHKDVYFNVKLVKTPEECKDYPVNIFCHGRRISSLCHLKSFMKISRYPWVWSHPNLTGYVEASCLTPVITRDEFEKNALRNKVYKALLALEADVSSNLEHQSPTQSGDAFIKIQSVINSALSSVVRSERRELKVLNGEYFDIEDEPKKTERTVSKNEVDETRVERHEQDAMVKKPHSSRDDEKEAGLARGVGLGVRFVQNLDNNRRAKLSGHYIEIDVAHEDFISRASTKDGKVRLTERLLGYIANIVSAAYRSNLQSLKSAADLQMEPFAQYSETETADRLYDEMLDSIVESSTKLEAKLQSMLPALQKELKKITPDNEAVP